MQQGVRVCGAGEKVAERKNSAEVMHSKNLTKTSKSPVPTCSDCQHFFSVDATHPPPPPLGSHFLEK